MVVQPSGTVTLVFTDIEGSTRLLSELGQDAYLEALARHRGVVREAFARYGGYEVDYEGDAFFYAFPSAAGALAAVQETIEGLAAGPIWLRVGVHTGEPGLDPPKYVGIDVHKAARIMSAGHGGQVLVSQATRDLVGDRVLLVDLGEHRLKDLSGPQRLYQLVIDGLPDEFPALKTLYQTNLPVPATPFLGRERELAEVVGLLTRGDARLVTLTGPGGTGKTRLALQAAAEASEEYPDGVWWVPLAPLRDPALVLSSVAQTLDVKEHPGRKLADSLGERLAGKRLLLLLDNIEHLLPAAASAVSDLRAANGSMLVVTSRERLRVAGERSWPVPPLSDADGVTLFLARAADAGVELAPAPAVVELCRRLDELPLALELAAARSPLFSPEQLVERLGQRLDLFKGGRDADPRQQTLRATIEWSCDLLTEEEQDLFRRLSVFSGGCSYEAAEAVCDADPDTLQSLLDRSLLRRREDPTGEPRYWMLETIREYALERLDESGETDDLRRRHAEHFLALAEQEEPLLLAAPQTAWFERLEEEHDNIRLALAWLHQAGEAELALRFAGRLWEFWHARGSLSEGRRWLEDTLATGADQPAPLRARALNGASFLAYKQGDSERARTCAEASSALVRDLDDPFLRVDALFMRGMAAIAETNYERAREFLEETAALCRELGYTRSLAASIGNLGNLALIAGDYERATALCEEAVALSRELEWRPGIAGGLENLGFAALLQSRYGRALELLKEGLTYSYSQKPAYSEVVTCCVEGLGAVAASQREAARAARLLAAAEALREASGYAWEPAELKLHERTIPVVRAQLSEDAFEAAWSQGRAMSVEQVVSYAHETGHNARAGSGVLIRDAQALVPRPERFHR